MKKRILVVEDDLGLRILWELILVKQFAGYHLDWAVSCEEACKLVQSSVRYGSTYSLIITDLFLSGQETGLDLIRFLSRHLYEAPVMLVSVVEEEILRESYGDLLTDRQVLTKPLSVPQCYEALERIFGVDVKIAKGGGF